MSRASYYITTPLYYVNAKPHIGHAYTNILCDTFARFHRLLGQDVFFMTGTDEHGTKIEKTAREHQMEPKAYVDSIVPHFKALWEKLEVSYDFFFRTTDDFHKHAVQRILQDLEAKGEIYKATYTGWYSVKSETFYAESELVNGRCPDTGGEVQKIEEENYFFRMSKYQDWLIGYIQDHPEFIRPEMRRNEILGFLKQPLQDLCITRPRERLEWGIPYPSSSKHVVYVWFDALINYISGAGYLKEDERFRLRWPADVHVVGKDILRHHAVYWPAMLKASGLQMPKSILAHGWWTIAGAKVSKSSGNAVDPMALIDKYGIDAFRYFLLREVTVGFDGAFSEELMDKRYTSDLANDLGNLWLRFASMVGRYFHGKMPPRHPGVFHSPMVKSAFELWTQSRNRMLEYDPRGALEKIWELVTRANQFVEERKPWALAKDASRIKELEETMGILAECLAHISIILLPFMPDTAGKLLAGLGLPSTWCLADPSGFEKLLVPEGAEIIRGNPLFPRFDEKAGGGPHA